MSPDRSNGPTLRTGAGGAPAGADANSRGNGLLIINADDWGGWLSATDAARVCFAEGRITSVSAMVFMEDSERAAALAEENGVSVGLHLNFNQTFTGRNCPTQIVAAHQRIQRFLRSNKYAQLLYHPGLRRDLRSVYHAQREEFERLYGSPPTHLDGHQHMHLCSNVILDNLLPQGVKVRRSFSFWPGEKSFLNRAYRGWVDGRLGARHVVTDYFFSLEQCLRHERLARVAKLAADFSVELMTHPEKRDEQRFLLGRGFAESFGGVKLADYSQLQPAAPRRSGGSVCSSH